MPAGFGGGLNTNSTGLAGQALLGLGDDARATKAAGFVGSLQVSCEIIADNDALAPDTVGAIAYDGAGLSEAQEFGIDATNGDQWTRATSQAILGLGTPTIGELSAAGADPDLPAVQTCTAPTTPPTKPSTTTGTSSAPSSSSPASSHPDRQQLEHQLAVVGRAVHHVEADHGLVDRLLDHRIRRPRPAPGWSSHHRRLRPAGSCRSPSPVRTRT